MRRRGHALRGRTPRRLRSCCARARMERLATLASHLCHSAPAPQPTAAATGGGSRDHNHHDHVLVVGGTGLIGRAAAEHFASSSSPLRGGGHVTTISRRALPYSLPDPSRHTHLELDLCDREACLSAMRALPTPVTHLIYAAMGTTPVDADPSNGTAIDVGDQTGRALNSTMFDNLLNALERTSGGDDEGALHVQLLQGRLAYGGWAVAPSLFPSREDRPDRSPSWYFDQEDQLRARLKLCVARNKFSHTRIPLLLLVHRSPRSVMACLLLHTGTRSGERRCGALQRCWGTQLAGTSTWWQRSEPGRRCGARAARPGCLAPPPRRA